MTTEKKGALKTGIKSSKKYRNNKEKVEQALENTEMLSIAEAIKTLVSLEQPNFKEGATLELHINLNIDPTKSDQFIRSNVTLPHGTGKDITIAAFVTPENVDKAKKAGAKIVGSDDLIEEINKKGKIDFDIAVAEPQMMTKLPKIARILGSAGVMPNPKTQTVGENVEELIEVLLKGKVNFKNDNTGNLHIICGKINKNFDEQKLVENVEATIDAVKKSKPDAVKKKLINTAHLSTSQSPSIRII